MFYAAVGVMAWLIAGLITNCLVAAKIGWPRGKEEWGVFFICLLVWPMTAWEFLRPNKKSESIPTKGEKK